jgi:hypothetical protein
MRRQLQQPYSRSEPVEVTPGIRPRLAVSYEDPGQAIASDFIGLSYESAILAGGGYFSPDNVSGLGLIRSLGEKGVIRIGGNTSERTVWVADVNHADPASFVITPANIDRLAAALHGLGWKLIYGLNLARCTPAEAADEAAYVANAVGANLLAFQIGNEPDGFGRWTAARPPSYDVSSYLAEWRTLQTAIRARVPGAPFAGPDVSGATDWIAAFAQAIPEGLVLLTHHYYADGPAGAPYDEGQPGVSDTLGGGPVGARAHVPGRRGGIGWNQFPWRRSQSARKREQSLHAHCA